MATSTQDTGHDFGPIARESVAEKVAGRILELIKAGNLKPGDQLPPERELANMLQVSRPSVREALRGLTILGVVRTRQGGGAFISSLNASDLLEPLQFYITLDRLTVDSLYEARIAIESTVATLAAERLETADLDRLRALLGPQKNLIGDPIGFRVSDQEFHSIIWKASGNPFVERVARSLNVLGMDYRRIASESPGVLGQSYKDHIAIVAAMETRSPEQATAAMVKHMQNVHRTTLQAMEASGEQPVDLIAEQAS